MSTTRVPKRRKLDDADERLQHDLHQSSPALAKRAASSIVANTSRSSPSTGSKALSGTELWQQARATSRSYRLRDQKQEQNMDVYFDFEGASTGQYPYGRLDGEKKKMKTLDPLMNQKSQESATSGKTNGTASGFFKQFRKDRVKTVETNGSQKNIKGRTATEQRTDEAREEESGGEEAQVRGTGSMRGYVYAKPKKTFEDEIRELEEQARRGAEQESEDELASSTETPRLSARKMPQRRTSARPQVELKETSGTLRTRVKPLDRRKVSARSEAPSQPPRGHEDEAKDIEIDASEDERLAQADVPSVENVEDALQLALPKKTPSRIANISLAKGVAAFESGQLLAIQKVVLEKTTGKRPIPLINLTDEYAKVSSVISQTITAGESNSMLLIGARGSGKTALINQILREQTAKHPDDFHAIRLNGFIHTDDKIALREIWRQLGREMELEDDEGTSKNYADTMSKLLALLSHPNEMGMDQQANQITKSIIFVLDEFELFAGHPRQTLLYNLFDIAQSRKAPIAVLGLTTRVDVAESLEKRVKSRFSHRYVHLSLSKSLQAFEQTCRKGLEVATEDLEDGDLEEWELKNLGKTVKVQEQSTGEKVEVPATLFRWDCIVEGVLASEAVSAFLRRVYYTTKSVSDVLSSVTLAIATMPTAAEVTAKELINHIATSIAHTSLQAPDSKLDLLSTLSSLQLALLISAARLTNIYNTEIITFALVYQEYKLLASKAKLQASTSGALAQGSRVWGKDVARGAWEELMEYGLVMKQGATGRVDIGLAEIGTSGVELGHWGRWCREI